MDHRELAEWKQRAAKQREDTVRHYTVNEQDLKVIEAMMGRNLNKMLLDFLVKAHGGKTWIEVQRAIWKARDN